MSKAYAVSQLINGDLGGFRNKIINGDFGIAQRGTSFTIASGSIAYTADRWTVHNKTDQPCDVHIFPRHASSWPEIGHPPFMEIRFAAAPTTGNVEVSQPIEGVRTLAGKLATLTFYSAASATDTEVNTKLIQGFGGAGSSPQVEITGEERRTVLSGGNAIRWDYLFNVPSVSGKVIVGNNDVIRAYIVITPREVKNYFLTKVSFVEGDATAEPDPFSPRHIQQELALCQRYFCETYASITYYPEAPSRPGTALVSFPVTMRRTPTLSKIGTPMGSVNVKDTFLYIANALNFKFEVTSSAAGLCYVDAQTISADAEL